MNASEVYLDLRNPAGEPIQGDVEATDYLGQIALYDWEWGMSLDEAPPKGSVQATQVKPKEFSFSKAVDAASMAMLSLLHSGDVCEKAIITLAQRTDKNIMLRVILKKVRLMSCDLNVDSDDQEVMLDEDWVLSFQEIEILYKGAEQKQDVRGKVGNSTLRGATTSFKMTVPAGAQPEVSASRGTAEGGSRRSRRKADALDTQALERSVEELFTKYEKKFRG